MTLDLESLWLITRNAANCGAYTRVQIVFEWMERIVEGSK